MCGIFGMAGSWPRLCDGYSGGSRLGHRGPDARGRWCDDEVVLEHTRLSIIDLSPDANQPFSLNPRYVITYNGEIFNFEDLRAKVAAGTRFTTRSDTEVLFRLLEQQGTAALEHLNGMFAFAFYDRERKRLLLARDRFGVKPLYYHHDARGLVFSSEQKAIYPLVDADVDRDALAEYLAFKFVSGSRTLVQGVSELEPGHLLEFDVTANALSTRRWYQLPVGRDGSAKGVAEATETLLEDAVRVRLVGDVPVGLQLSGGVDSSLVAYMVSERLGRKLHSYSIGFPGSDHDETGFAQRLADRFGLQHCPIEFTVDDFVALWERATWHNDEPLNHPHSLPIYKLNQVARSDVTVLLSGEGADEVFLGYDQHRRYLGLESLDDAAQFYRFLPHETVRLALAHRGPATEDDVGCRRAMAGEAAGAPNALTILEFQLHLNTLLNRIDKMSMASAVEIRTPFLDVRLVELGVRAPIPSLVGSDGGSRKLPLMQLYEKFFGDGLSRRPKIGFRVPFDDWLRTDDRFRDTVLQLILQLEDGDLLSSAYVRGLTDRLHRQTWAPEVFREAWVAANLSIWHRLFTQDRHSPVRNSLGNG